jgi:peptide/nickel transport system substrate-binding protein
VNYPRYCNPEMDKVLNEARTISDEAGRRAKYAAALDIVQKDMSTIYLYFEPRIFAMNAKLKGLVAHPDGMIRFENLKFGG